MLHWLSRRLLTSAVTLFGVVTVTFLLARVVPSNPAAVYIGPLARPAELARVTKQLGLDRPLPVQYAKYLRSLAEGDWGTSLATKEPVLGGILTRLPATLELIVSAMVLAIVLGIPFGVVAAYRRGRPPDVLVRLGSVFGISMPVFWLGLLLQALFSGKLGLLPATSRLLRRLERRGLLESAWATAGGRRRRVYRLTRRGRAELEEKRSDWHRFARAVRAVLA